MIGHNELKSESIAHSYARSFIAKEIKTDEWNGGLPTLY